MMTHLWYQRSMNTSRQTSGQIFRTSSADLIPPFIGGLERGKRNLSSESTRKCLNNGPLHHELHFIQMKGIELFKKVESSLNEVGPLRRRMRTDISRSKSSGNFSFVVETLFSEEKRAGRRW
jgi:hypothetical protein